MRFLSALYSLILPTACIHCDAEGEIICRACTIYFSNSPLFKGSLVSFVDATDFQSRIASSLPYSDVVARIILGAKDDGNMVLQQVVVDALLRARSLFPSELTLVPVPSTRAARMRRGRDFVREITQALARETGDSVIQLLVSRQGSLPQKSLNAKERIANMKGAFVMRSPRTHGAIGGTGNRPVLVIDDVLTTGATMRAALGALAAGGATCIGGISAAYSPNWKVSQRGY